MNSKKFMTLLAVKRYLFILFQKADYFPAEYA